MHKQHSTLTSVARNGIRTGSLETHYAVRHGVAFDLGGINSNDTIVSAHLRVRQSDCRRVVLSDPSARVQYGICGVGRGRNSIRLNATALQDLRLATGSFFWIEATISKGDGHSSLQNDSSCVLDLTLAASGRATSALDAVA